MTEAFVLGNGRSRGCVNLENLQALGVTYGCNALYREFTPCVLVAADRAISETIQHLGYAQQHMMYTRKPLPGLGARRIPDRYWGYSSGQAAVAIACIDRHNPVYMLGFDLGSTNERFNNVYADTEFYKASHARPTYAGNWIRQIIQIARDFPECQLIRVRGSESADVPDFRSVFNIQDLSMENFCKNFGI